MTKRIKLEQKNVCRGKGIIVGVKRKKFSSFLSSHYSHFGIFSLIHGRSYGA
jgi:hypothetical protein